MALDDMARGIRDDEDGNSRCVKFSMDVANAEFGTACGLGATVVLDAAGHKK